MKACLTELYPEIICTSRKFGCVCICIHMCVFLCVHMYVHVCVCVYALKIAYFQLTFRERECVPRFAEPGTIEFEIASRWAVFYDHEKAMRDELEVRVKEQKVTVEKEIQQLYEQQQTLIIRQGKQLSNDMHLLVFKS